MAAGDAAADAAATRANEEEEAAASRSSAAGRRCSGDPSRAPAPSATPVDSTARGATTGALLCTVEDAHGVLGEPVDAAAGAAAVSCCCCGIVGGWSLDMGTGVHVRSSWWRGLLLASSATRSGAGAAPAGAATAGGIGAGDEFPPRALRVTARGGGMAAADAAAAAAGADTDDEEGADKRGWGASTNAAVDVAARALAGAAVGAADGWRLWTPPSASATAPVTRAVGAAGGGPPLGACPALSPQSAASAGEETAMCV